MEAVADLQDVTAMFRLHIRLPWVRSWICSSSLRSSPLTLMMPKMPAGSFAKKLYSLYLTYLRTEKFKYALNMNVDNRGSFTELVHTEDCGQVSINISRPGITKGQHWHNSKWELFIVVAGHGLFRRGILIRVRL